MRVLIVGAGPTGAALSYLLARRGIDVVLLEREERFDRVFRGEALMPGGVDAIDQMGLREAFDHIPHRKVECMEFYVDGRRIMRADWPEIAGPNAAQIVSQPALIEMFVGAAHRNPSFKQHMGATARDLRLTPKGVELDVETPIGPNTMKGDVIIGADGRASLIRSRLNLKLERLSFPFDVAWFSVPNPPWQEKDPRFQAFIRAGRLAVLYPSWEERLRVGLNVSHGEASQLSETPKVELLGLLGRVTGEPYASFLREQEAQISEPVILKILFGRCSEWSVGRALLLGDAAHPMSPVRAQGINLALRDAIVAANHLIPAFESGGAEAFQAAANRIQEERAPEIVESQRLQMRAAEPPLLAQSAVLRATLLPVLRQLGVLKRIFLKTEIPLRGGIVPVQLSV